MNGARFIALGHVWTDGNLWFLPNGVHGIICLNCSPALIFFMVVGQSEIGDEPLPDVLTGMVNHDGG